MNSESNRLSTSAYLGIFAGLIIGTYILPYLGSNSWVSYVATKKLGMSLVPFYIKFTAHTLLYVGMEFLAFRASQGNGKKWLLVFPILAGLFDLAPNLNMIPLAPTALNFLGAFLCYKEYNQVPAQHSVTAHESPRKVA